MSDKDVHQIILDELREFRQDFKNHVKEDEARTTRIELELVHYQTVIGLVKWFGPLGALGVLAALVKAFA